MSYTLKLYSEFENEIEKFLKLYFNEDFNLENKYYWISLDKDVYIDISENNINSLIKYIYERFPY